MLLVEQAIMAMTGSIKTDGVSAEASDCSSNFKFASQDLNVPPLKEDLEFCWPSFTMPNEYFWGAEWENHGICSGMSPIDYFTKGVNTCLQVSVKIYAAFTKANISPGPDVHHTPMDYYYAILDEFGYQPQIRCMDDGNRQKKYLYEVRFCSDMNLNLQDCNTHGSLPGCGPYSDRFVTPVYFP